MSDEGPRHVKVVCPSLKKEKKNKKKKFVTARDRTKLNVQVQGKGRMTTLAVMQKNKSKRYLGVKDKPDA